MARPRMIFPLWVKWLLVNPKPRESLGSWISWAVLDPLTRKWLRCATDIQRFCWRFWYEDYGAFPLLAGDFDSEELLLDLRSTMQI